MLTEVYLKNSGFKKDDTAPNGVNRWKHYKMCDHHISITFNNEGTETLYGFIHRNDGLTNAIINKVDFRYEAITVDFFETALKRLNIKIR